MTLRILENNYIYANIPIFIHFVKSANRQIMFRKLPMSPYPFSYFRSGWGLRRPLVGRKALSWFQLVFTSLFLIALLLLPVSLQNAQRTSYPLETFIDKVYNPLTPQVMEEVKQARIENHRFSYGGQNPSLENEAGQVLLGLEKPELGQNLTLAFTPENLIISKEKQKLAEISYQHLDQEALSSKGKLTQAISQDWFIQNRLTISLFLVLTAGFLISLNFTIVLVGASFLLYLTKKSRLFVFGTFKECLNFILNCLLLPSLLALIAGILGQDLSSMITLQNISFVLYLVLIFYKTHFRDEK